MFPSHYDGFQIKLANKSEANLVKNMLKQVAQWLNDNEINQWRFLLEGGDDEEIDQAVTNQQTYIVLEDHEIIATFTLSSKQSDWDKHIWGEDFFSRSLYIHRLAITPRYMKKGIGKNILIWIHENSKGDIEYLKLDCVADNIKLNNFYKSNGFEHIGVTDGHSKYQKVINNSVQE